jgi:arylsulfatase A-like enzyme
MTGRETVSGEGPSMTTRLLRIASWCLALLVAVAGFGSAPRAAAGQPAVRDGRRPNILLIYADDQSYKTVGCYPEAYPGVKTPNIDALAASGIRFRGAYLGAWCMPSRATMLTGRLPHGVESMRMAGTYPASVYDPELCPFWPKVFRAGGYVTAQIGKWHTGIDAGTGRDWDWQIVWNRPKYPENAGKYYDGQVLSINGAEAATTTGYSTDNYTKWALQFIRGEHRDPSKPWYLWLCYGGIHGPTTPAARHQGMHKDDPVPIPADIFPPRPGKPDYLNRTQAWARGADGRPVVLAGGANFDAVSGRDRRPYTDFIHQLNDCTQSIDEGVGAVMAALKETNQLADTLVIYTADQGFGMGEHGFRSKLAPYDATYRSPLIVSMPGTFPQGKVSPKCVTAADLVVTFFAMAGLELPWPMHGRDITPLLKSPEGPWEHPAFYEYTGDHFGSDVTRIVTTAPQDATHQQIPWYVALRDDRWKYIRYLTPDETEELYDLTADPDELSNLADRTEHRPTLRSLRQRALAELRRTGADFADRLPATRQMRGDAR